MSGELDIGSTVRYRGQPYILVGRERRDGSGPWETAKLRPIGGGPTAKVPYREIARIRWARKTPGDPPADAGAQ